MIFHDAHNHLQDERFGGRQDRLIEESAAQGVGWMVVNGSCEEDWGAVLELARKFPGRVLPSVGLHPWYTAERNAAWREKLESILGQGGVGVGEIGLDRWKPGLSWDGQEDVFLQQLDMAVRLDLPVSIHCLKAWGRLLELLREVRVPSRGFLLHSYGGSLELVRPLADLGAWFSFPGFFMRPDKARKLEAFRAVPLDRLLVETDAPDQLPPPGGCLYSLEGPEGVFLNHPGNLPRIYGFAADLKGLDLETFAARIERNFRTFFEPLLGTASQLPKKPAR